MTTGIKGSNSENNPNLKHLSQPFRDPPNLVWEKTYNGDFKFLLQTCDNGYILGGNIFCGSSRWKARLVKTDIDGNEEWNKTFEGPKVADIFFIRETSEGGYILCGLCRNDGRNFGDQYGCWIIKTDENGDMIWNKRFEFKDSWVLGKSIIVVDDGYLILAEINDVGYGYHDIWLIKTDFDGNEFWNKTVGNSHGEDWPYAFIKDSDDNIVISGSYSLDKVLLIKTDLNGNSIWRKTLDGEEGHDIKECDDGGYIISDALNLVKADRDGNMEWRKEYDWGGIVESSVDITSDGGYILVGAGSYVMIKADKDGNREWEKILSTGQGGYNNHVIQSNDGDYVAVWHDLMVKVSPFENQRPNKPSKPEGPILVRPNTWYNYTTSSSDPDGEIVYYRWENKYFYDFCGPYDNNETCETTLEWFFIGKDKVIVKASDIYGGDSEWVELDVTISWNKAINSMLLLRLHERFPLLQKLLHFFE